MHFCISASVTLLNYSLGHLYSHYTHEYILMLSGEENMKSNKVMGLGFLICTNELSVNPPPLRISSITGLYSGEKSLNGKGIMPNHNHYNFLTYLKMERLYF